MFFYSSHESHFTIISKKLCWHFPWNIYTGCIKPVLFLKKITRKWFKINSSNFHRIEEYLPCIFFYKFQYIIMKRMKLTAMFITELVKCQFCITFISINGHYSVNFIKMTKWKLFYVFCVICKEEIDVLRYI